MSWLSKALGLDRLTNAGKIPPMDRETTLWLALKLLKPDQRAALRTDIAIAIQGLDDPKYREAARAFLMDANSAINR